MKAYFITESIEKRLYFSIFLQKKENYDTFIVIMIKFFRHHYTIWEVFIKRVEAFFVGAAIILFWRGIWNLADHYLFPGYSNISAIASLVIGM